MSRQHEPGRATTGARRALTCGAVAAAVAAALALGGCGSPAAPANPPHQQNRGTPTPHGTPSPLPTFEPTKGHAPPNQGAG